MGDCTVIDWVAVSRHITTETGMNFEAWEIQRTVGSSIKQGCVVTDSKKLFVVKTRRVNRYTVFENEVRSLSVLVTVGPRLGYLNRSVVAAPRDISTRQSNTCR